MDIIDNLLIVPLLAGGILILAGIVMKIFPPKKINSLYGYRTPNSMENQAKWDFAQHYSAKDMIKWGGILLFTSILGIAIDSADDFGLYLGLVLFIASVVILIVRVEKAINKKFLKNKISE